MSYNSAIAQKPRQEFTLHLIALPVIKSTLKRNRIEKVRFSFILLKLIKQNQYMVNN